MLDTESTRWRRLAASLARTVGIVQLRSLWPPAQALGPCPRPLLHFPDQSEACRRRNQSTCHPFFYWFPSVLFWISMGKTKEGDPLMVNASELRCLLVSSLGPLFHYWCLFSRVVAPLQISASCSWSMSDSQRSQVSFWGESFAESKPNTSFTAEGSACPEYQGSDFIRPIMK